MLVAFFGVTFLPPMQEWYSGLIPYPVLLPIQGLIILLLIKICSDFSRGHGFFVVDVHPDGLAYNVSDGILRRSYQKDPRESTASKPTEIEVFLWPTSMVFLKGHRIRLEVSSSNFPRFDRNPNTGRPIATEKHSVVATQTIHHNSEALSRLILPVIPREDRDRISLK